MRVCHLHCRPMYPSKAFDWSKCGRIRLHVAAIKRQLAQSPDLEGGRPFNRRSVRQRNKLKGHGTGPVVPPMPTSGSRRFRTARIRSCPSEPSRAWLLRPLFGAAPGVALLMGGNQSCVTQRSHDFIDRAALPTPGQVAELAQDEGGKWLGFSL